MPIWEMSGVVHSDASINRRVLSREDSLLAPLGCWITALEGSAGNQRKGRATERFYIGYEDYNC